MREGQKRDLARGLRRNATEAERIIWRLLRDRRLAGIKFRRQVPIGPFIADFAAIEHRLVVELDGGQHADSESDVRRDRFLTAHGWRVLRVWNNELMTNREGVLEAIHDALALAPTLSRKRERGGRDALALTRPLRGRPLPQAGEG
jgi:very-short-patch-repair endonuclease